VQPTDDEIEQAIARVRRQSIEDFQLVVEAYQRRLRAIVASWCPPSIDADEISHLAFIQAFKRIDDYRPGSSFFAWLCTIARYQLLAELKKVKREGANKKKYLDVVLARTLQSTLSGVELMEEDRVDALRDCTAQLDERAREVLRMRYTGEASIAAISQQTGKSISAIKFQLFRIRQILRDCVNRKLGLQGSAP